MTARMPIWNAEGDADDQLAEVDMNVAMGSAYGGMGMVFDELALQQHLLAQQQQVQQQQHQQLASIPEVVRRFILQLQQAIHTQNTAEILLLYEGWNKLSEKFYAKTEWPDSEVISVLVGEDPVFLILYRELYYRHVYSKLQPNIDERFHSYENSCELFNYLLSESCVSFLVVCIPECAFQTVTVRYRSHYLHNGYGTSSTSSSTSSSHSAPGGPKSTPRPTKNFRCWAKTVVKYGAATVS